MTPPAALAYAECVADDVQPGQRTSFLQSVRLQPGETVVFAWIVYKSHRDRDRINKAVMGDGRPAPGRHDGCHVAAFDGKRMFRGGFEPIADI